MIFDNIDLLNVGGNNVPVSPSPIINESKASLILLDRHLSNTLKPFLCPSVLNPLGGYFCNVTYYDGIRDLNNTIANFEVINGVPMFPYPDYHSAVLKGYAPFFLSAFHLKSCPSFYNLLSLDHNKTGSCRSHSELTNLEKDLICLGADRFPFGRYHLGEKFSRINILSNEARSYDAGYVFFPAYQVYDLTCAWSSLPQAKPLHFFDEQGNHIMNVSVVFEESGEAIIKSYIPETDWYVHHSRQDEVKKRYPHITHLLRDYSFFSVPVALPGKQPLLNIDCLADAETVVICSSPENTVALQDANDDMPVVFTGFVCDHGQYNEVDWSPLKGKSVWIEIANHSGLTLAEAYIEANGLYEHLRDVVKVEELHFLQRAIEYPSMVGVRNVDDLVRANRVNPPRVVEDSIKEFDEAEFQDMVEKAKTEIARKTAAMQDLAFWKDEQQAETGSVENTKPVGRITDKIILRPYIIAGTTTLITGAPNVGKSCFKTAMSACIAGSPRKFLEGRFWSRCTPTDANQYKVVDLIFDSDGEEAIADHRRDFASDIGENAVNYVQKDMSGDPINYLKHENYTAFEKILDDCEAREGVPGQRIDVLVLDTLFALSHEANTFHAMNEFIKHLNHDRPYMAVLVLHHLNNQDRAYGGVRVLTGIRAHIKLFRTEEQQEACKGRNPLLSDPFTVAIEKASNNKIPEDGESFAVRFDETQKAFVVAEPEDKEKVHARRKAIVEGYAKQGLTQPEIARLFGVDERTIRNWINKSE